MTKLSFYSKLQAKFRGEIEDNTNSKLAYKSYGNIDIFICSVSSFTVRCDVTNEYVMQYSARSVTLIVNALKLYRTMIATSL